MLSGKERDRLKVLHEVQGGHLTQGEAAGHLGISDREVRRLLVRIEEQGDGGVVHRLRGKVSNRRLPESLRTRALKLVKAKYHDFGPTLACEYLAKEHAVEVSKETLRQWLMAAGYSVDALALRALPDGHGTDKKRYSLNGVNVRTVSVSKKRRFLARFFFQYVAFFLWVFVRVPLQMHRRRYALIEVNSLPDLLVFAPVLAKWMGAKLVLDMHEITPEFYMAGG